MYNKFFFIILFNILNKNGLKKLIGMSRVAFKKFS